MFGGLFTKKGFLDPEDEAWHLESWAWLLRHLGGISALRRRPLVRATASYFPPSSESGHARAEHIFSCVKKLAGISDWPCILVEQPKRPEPKVAELGLLKVEKSHLPLGSFSVSEGTVTITYDPDSLKNPVVLVATLAHELAHYLLATIQEEPPGGEDMHEYLTDLATVCLGFGLFGANSAFNFSQHTGVLSQGWRTSSRGYLRERDWAFALAVFLVLRNENAVDIRRELKPHLYDDMRSGLKYLESNPVLLDAHRAIGA